MEDYDIRDGVAAAEQLLQADNLLPTLRDRFAMAALIALIPEHAREDGISPSVAAGVADDAYILASAMIEARKEDR